MKLTEAADDAFFLLRGHRLFGRRLDGAELGRRRWKVPPFCCFFRRVRDFLPAEVVLYAGGAGRALRDGQVLHGQISYLFLVLLDEDVFIPH